MNAIPRLSDTSDSASSETAQSVFVTETVPDDCCGHCGNPSVELVRHYCEKCYPKATGKPWPVRVCEECE